MTFFHVAPRLVMRDPVWHSQRFVKRNEILETTFDVYVAARIAFKEAFK